MNFSLLASLIVGHLWQSTVFAALAGISTLAFRENRANTRFGIWFAASLKFFIPFSLLFNVGNRLGWSVAPVRAPFFDWFLYVTGDHAASSIPVLTPASQAPSGTPFALILPLVWLLGFFAVLLRWHAEWRRVRSIVRAAEPVSSGREWDALQHLRRQIGMTTPVALISTAAPIEPCVFGIRRSVLILPANVPGRLDQAQMEAIIAHELAHVRRQDNLLAAIHMAVQAVFWFHPLVWWFRLRLLDERERACDEDVLRFGNDPLVYAESIIQVCRCSLASPATCVSGVTSADIGKRLERIMSRSVGQALSRAKKALLTTAAVTAIIGPFGLGLFSAPRGSAQQMTTATANLPAFEVATIRPSSPDSNLKIDFAPGGRLVVTHATLRFLIKIAYDVTDDQVLGGPAWLSSRRFDVEAKPSAPLGGDPKSMSDAERSAFTGKVRLRLRRLLAERFQLELRSDSKAMPVFALIVGRNGPKLKQNTSPGDPHLSSGHGILTATRVNMDFLARFLGEGQVGRPVIDMTGLTGNYDFAMQWSPDPSLNPGFTDNAANPAADSNGLSIFTALQRDLGLKLDPRTSPANYLAVERAELPAAN